MKKVLLILFTICAVQTAKAQYGWYMPMPDPASFAQQYMQQQNNQMQQFYNSMQQVGNAIINEAYNSVVNNPNNAYMYYDTPAPQTNTYESDDHNHNHGTESRYGNKTCYMCNGQKVCSTCNGKGWFYSEFGNGKIDCPNCTDGTCSKCGGSGTIYGLLMP